MTLASQADLFSEPPPRERTRTRSGAELRDEALALLEVKRAAYVMRARAVAETIYARLGYVTVDLIREECPPPAEIKGQVMGTVCHWKQGWRVDDTRKIFSDRGLNHGKRIAAFIRAEKAGAG